MFMLSCVPCSLLTYLAAFLFDVAAATLSAYSPMSSSLSDSIISSKGSSLNNYATRLLQFYSENPGSQLERNCLSALDAGTSIDVIIDIATNPELDDFDTLSVMMPDDSSDREKAAERNTANVYFDSIALFLDLLQVDFDPERLFSVLIDKGQKYFITGKKLNRTRTLAMAHSGDSGPCSNYDATARSAGNRQVKLGRLDDIQMTSLGTVTKLSLQARDNGLPIVLRSSKTSVTLYSIVITDGSSGLPGLFFSQDRSKTTIIDVGKRRFLSRMSYNALIQYAGVISLEHPQQLPNIVSTIRYTACKIIEAAQGARR